MTLEQTVFDSGVSLRPAQEAILAYCGGPLAISAVPGAGKTFILEQLAARLIEREGAKPSEILVLTYMRSAALNIKRRVAKTLSARGRTAYGLQASTIHAFALAVQRRARGDDMDEAPLVVLSETERRRILMTGLETWLSDPVRRKGWDQRHEGHDPDRDDPFMSGVRVAEKAIAEAKHHGHSPDDLDRLLGRRRPELAFLYRRYLAAQAELGASDYDDLIHEAVRLLRTDADLRGFYQRTVRWVLEDEAQDSTPAQQQLLDLLTGPEHGGAGNLVRVGDTNQAIMASFTHNDPRYFRAFCAARDLDQRHKPMPESSRSALPIIELANRLVDVVGARHPDEVVAQAFTGQHIYAATAGKANPQATSPCTWSFYAGKKKDEYATREEIGVMEHVRAYLRANPTRRAAVLVPTHKLRLAYQARAEAMAIALQPETRAGVGTKPCLALLGRVLIFLGLPALKQAEAFLAIVKTWGDLREVTWADWDGLKRFAMATGAEALLYPPAGLPPARPEALAASDYAGALEVGRALRGFLAARHLPPSELLPTIAQTLLNDPHAAAIAAKAAAIATRHRDPARAGGDPLETLRAELEEIAKASGDRGELVSPPAELAPPEGGRLAVLTLHASKGLEFDAVWLPGLGLYYGKKGHFPWDLDGADIWDREGFMVKLALQPAGEGPATREDAELASRRLGVAEKLRLLYVGMTRAERELHLSASGVDEGLAVPHHVAALAAACERRIV